MPAPNRTTNDEIIAAARSLVDTGGQDALTMQAVAARVGVRAPSLYKRVQSKDRLLGLVIESTALELADVLGSVDARGGDDPRARLVAQAHALRGFAHEHPHLFGLLFGQVPDAARPSRDALARSSAPVLRATEQLVGPRHALDAARTVTAWAFGFLTMELAGAFQLGGDPESAFSFGADAVARAVAPAPES